MGTVRHLLSPEEAVLATSSFPAYQRNAGTNFPVTGLAYDASTDERAYFKRRLVNYGSGNLTLSLTWYADTASSGVVRWEAAIACITPDSDSQDAETKSFATAQTVDDTHLGTTGQRVHVCSVTISNLDSAAAGDIVWLRLSRIGSNGSDTMTGDAIWLEAELSYSDT
ncbi:hypothetical protein AB0395_41180 [Streptosporangium sp. NPDC051023]|uniref:hypothetical protein n=1 Tax=Streptosporangium sp. NPDC051023 TaxID=3155410 RepID=UPI003450503A